MSLRSPTEAKADLLRRAAEIGFDETKGYVQKVMSNYRVYRQLYTADLIRR